MTTVTVCKFFVEKCEKNLTNFCWNIEVWAVQKHVNPVDLVKSFPTSIYLQTLASIQPSTSLLKFISSSSYGIWFSPSRSAPSAELSSPSCVPWSSHLPSMIRTPGPEVKRFTRTCRNAWIHVMTMNLKARTWVARSCLRRSIFTNSVSSLWSLCELWSFVDGHFWTSLKCICSKTASATA